MQKSVIQTYGFRNVVEDGKVIGFQFKVRNPYYRGVYLSQILAGYATVDGVDYSRDIIEWIIGERQYTWQEMMEEYHTHWNPLQCATIIVKTPGGLKQGFHDLRFSFTCTKSYLGSSTTNNTAILPDSDPERSKATAFTSEFGATHHYRRMIIV